MSRGEGHRNLGLENKQQLGMMKTPAVISGISCHGESGHCWCVTSSEVSSWPGDGMFRRWQVTQLVMVHETQENHGFGAKGRVRRGWTRLDWAKVGRNGLGYTGLSRVGVDCTEDAPPVGTRQQRGSEDPRHERVLWLAGDRAPQPGNQRAQKAPRSLPRDVKARRSCSLTRSQSCQGTDD